MHSAPSCRMNRCMSSVLVYLYLTRHSSAAVLCHEMRIGRRLRGR
jgi:hypothetical protein